MSRTHLEIKLGGVVLDDFPHADNLAIALCTYYSDHAERPEVDPGTENGWGEWVEAKVNEAIQRIASAVDGGSEHE